MTKYALSQIAGMQYGYFTAQQARESGYIRQLHVYHVHQGNWLSPERGLFRLPGYPDTLDSDFIRWSFWAIGRSPNRQVVVSHESALFYYHLTAERPTDVHLTVPVKLFKKEEKTGCVFHREELNPEDVVSHTGYKITTPARTLLDMKPMLLLTSTWADTVWFAQENHLIDQDIARTMLGDILFQQAGGSGQSWARPAAQGALHVGYSGELCSAGMLQSNQRKTEMRDYGVRMGGGSYLGGRMVARSFTLVELLVVMMVITLLASMLLPVLKSALTQAQSMSCLNNEKQLGLLLRNYVETYDGFGPARTQYLSGYYLWYGYEQWSANFCNQLGLDKSTLLVTSNNPTPKLKLFYCPGRNGYIGTSGFSLGNYAYNTTYDCSLRIKKITAIRNPSRIISFIDATFILPTSYLQIIGRYDANTSAAYGRSGMPHIFERSNAAFMDGHAEAASVLGFQNTQDPLGYSGTTSISGNENYLTLQNLYEN